MSDITLLLLRVKDATLRRQLAAAIGPAALADLHRAEALAMIRELLGKCPRATIRERIMQRGYSKSSAYRLIETVLQERTRWDKAG